MVFPRIREAKPGADMGYDIDVEPDGVLDITIRGVWTKPAVDRFFDTLRPIHADQRGRYASVRALTTIDRFQAPEVALLVRSRALELKQPGDRNAFIVSTFLLKLQVQRLGGKDGFALFAERAVAMAWLRA